MQELQDDSLEKTLREKLVDYEADVPASSEGYVFSKLQAHQVGIRRRGALYGSAILLSIVGSFFLYNALHQTQENDGLTQTELFKEQPKLNPEKTYTTAITQEEVNEDQKVTDRKTKLVNPGQARIKQKLNRENPSVEPEETQEEVSSSLDFRSSPVVTNASEIKDENSKVTASDSVARVVSKSVDPEEAEPVPDKVRFSANVLPFLNYRRIMPNPGDGAHLSNFQSSGSRVGIKASVSVEFQINENAYWFAGLSYFSYQTQFTYNSNEAVSDITKVNSVDESVHGAGIVLGMRYPISIKAKRKQFISGGMDTQFLMGNYYALTSTNQFMINLGYTNEFEIGSKRSLRVQPAIYYSISKFQYPGLTAQPYWLGIEIGYVWWK